MVSLATAPQFLLRSNLLAPEAIVRGEVFAKDVSRRNSNFVVWHREGEAAYFLKTSRTPDAARTIAHEALVYRFLASLSGRSSEIGPRYYLFDADEGVLVLQSKDGAHNFQSELRSSSFTTTRRLSGHIGRALSLVHSITIDDLRTAPELARPSPPWVLGLSLIEWEQLGRFSRAQRELAAALHRHEEVLERLETLRTSWSPVCLIHGDLKPENILTYPSDDGRREIVLVDWEFARIGEPAWDVGSVLAGILVRWATSIPITDASSTGVKAELAAVPLSRVQAQAKSFWSAYAKPSRRRGLQRELLQSSVSFAGARIIQTAHEHLTYSSSMSGTTALLVQLGSNLLMEPEAACRDLLSLG